MRLKEAVMDPTQEILSEVRDLSNKTTRIETHIEYQKEQFDKIEKALTALEATKATVHRHDVQIKGFSWFLGVIASFFTLKFLGKI